MVTTNGCFDLLHVGHVRALKEAKTLGDVLVIGLNSDKSLAEYKPGRPIVPEAERKEILESLRWVNKVEIMDSAHVWLEDIAARAKEKDVRHVHVKGSEWKGGLPEPELAVVKKYGIHLVFMDRPEGGQSSSSLIAKIKALA